MVDVSGGLDWIRERYILNTVHSRDPLTCECACCYVATNELRSKRTFSTTLSLTSPTVRVLVVANKLCQYVARLPDATFPSNINQESRSVNEPKSSKVYRGKASRKVSDALPAIASENIGR